MIPYGLPCHSCYLPMHYCPSSVCFFLAIYHQIAKFSSFPRPVSPCVCLSFEKVYFYSNLFQILSSLNCGPVVFGVLFASCLPQISINSFCVPPPPSDHAGTSPSSFHGTAAAASPSADVKRGIVISSARELMHEFPLLLAAVLGRR